MFSKFSIFILLVFLIITSCAREGQDKTGQPEQQTAQTAGLTGNDLRAAALNGNLQGVEEAIEEEVAIDDVDELGRSALMFASFNGHTETVRLLVNEGAEVNLINTEGRTALMFAASGPFPETVLLLLESGADVNVSDTIEGWTPLMYAAAEGNRSVVDELLNYGADVSLEDKDGETAIDFATDNGHTETVTLLRNGITQ